ncbi:MAG: PrsW family intramembrane metalloprotease [Lachnospiraceae bacterium]|nr:PrsW family intramembrane metalloprotease [Lachnospiraceae bacterium]
MILLIILVILAIIPGVVLLLISGKMDRVDKESPGILVSILLMELPFILAAALLECLFDDLILTGLFGFDETNVLGILIRCFLIIGPAEEFCKYMGARIPTWSSPQFNCKYDGIVYCTTSAMSFAIIENILYVATSGSFVTALLRAVMSVPGHFMFGVCMGIFYSRAKIAQVKGDNAGKSRNIWLALIIPAVFHGLYDSLCFLAVPLAVSAEAAESDAEIVAALGLLLLLLGAMFVLIIGIYVFLFITLRKESKSDYFFAPPMPGWVPPRFRKK